MINKVSQCESAVVPEMGVDPNRRVRESQAGFTLLELMISLGLGIAISWVVLDIALTGVRNHQDVITSGEVTENGRYLSNFLENELNHAGFYGQSQIIIPTGTGIPTRNRCTTSLSTNDLLHPIDGENNVDGSPFCGIENILPDSDVLIIRRASTAIQNQNLEDDQYYVQSNMDQVVLGTGASQDTVFTLENMNQSAAPIREFYEDIYYVDTSGNFNRHRLVGGSYVTEPLAAGVDDFQVQYHIDTNDEHFADIVREIPDGYDEWKNVMSVSTFFLISSTTNSNQTDAKNYNYGGKAGISFADRRKRRLFTSAAALDLRDPTNITVSETFIANFSFEDNVTDYYTDRVEGWTTWTGGSQNDPSDDVSGVIHKNTEYKRGSHKSTTLAVENYTGDYAVWIWFPSNGSNTRVEVDTGLNYEVIDNETSVYEFTVDLGDTSWIDPGDGYTYGGAGAYKLQIKVGTRVLGSVSGAIPDDNALTTVTISSENFAPKPYWDGNIKLAIENTGDIEILADNVTGTKTTTTINQF